MVLPFVSRGRYADMRERALHAEALVADLLNAVKQPSPLAAQQTVASTVPQTEAKKQEVQLPPVVLEAIDARAGVGTQLASALMDRAREAMDISGSDFDADLYADYITRGTRIKGWPT